MMRNTVLDRWNTLKKFLFRVKLPLTCLKTKFLFKWFYFKQITLKNFIQADFGYK